jgi:hypothetical protein
MIPGVPAELQTRYLTNIDLEQYNSAGKLPICVYCITGFGAFENYVFWYIDPHHLQKVAPTGKNLLPPHSEQKRLHCSYLFYPEDICSSFLQNL